MDSRADIDIIVCFRPRRYRSEDKRRQRQYSALAIIRRVHSSMLVATGRKDPMIHAEPARAGQKQPNKDDEIEHFGKI
jgi:hypothetical protein